MVPFIATIIVLAVGILVICVAYSRRRGPDSGRNSKDVYCMLKEPQNYQIRFHYRLLPLIVTLDALTSFLIFKIFAKTFDFF